MSTYYVRNIRRTYSLVNLYPDEFIFIIQSNQIMINIKHTITHFLETKLNEQFFIVHIILTSY